jgi:hypothetical protein
MHKQIRQQTLPFFVFSCNLRAQILLFNVNSSQITEGGIFLKIMNLQNVAKLSPERVRIAKIFKAHVDRAVEELGGGYDVTLQGGYDKTQIRLEIEI